MTEILINLQALAGGETQLLALTGLFLGVLMVTMGGALAFAGRDDVERRLALAQATSRRRRSRCAAAGMARRPPRSGVWSRRATNANAWRYASGWFRRASAAPMRCATTI